MSYAKNMMNYIANAQSMGGRDRLAVGQHRVAVISFSREESKKQQGMGPKEGRLQATLEIQQSTVYQPGKKATISFFVERSNFPEYEFDRARQFIEGCMNCVTDLPLNERNTAEFGERMLDLQLQKGRGIVLDVLVTPDTLEDGSPKKGKKGNIYTSEVWTPLPQTLADVALARAELDKTYPMPQPAQAQNQYQAQQQTQWQQPQLQGQPQWQGQPQPQGQPQWQGQPQPQTQGNPGGQWQQGPQQGQPQTQPAQPAPGQGSGLLRR